MNIIKNIRQLNVSLNEQTRSDLLFQWVSSKMINRKEFSILLLHHKRLTK